MRESLNLPLPSPSASLPRAIGDRYPLWRSRVPAGPARALGMPTKGHLGVGADADIAVFNDDADIERMFGHPRYVVKGGEIIVEEGDIRKMVDGREYIVRPSYDEGIEEYLCQVFQCVRGMWILI